MAITDAGHGTLTGQTLGVDSTLATITSVGSFVLVVDASLLQDDEEFDIIIKTKVLTASTAAIEWQRTVKYSQSEKVIRSPVILSLFSAAFIINQANIGSARDIAWTIYRLDS